MNKSVLKYFFLIIFSLFSISIFAADDPRIEGLGKFKIFEALREQTPNPIFGYFFTISPDENWIANIGFQSDYYALNLFHIPTNRKWSYKLKIDHSIVGEWFPNCFSKDNSKMYFGKLTAPINPTMDKIDFKELTEVPDMESFEGSFLGFNGVVRNQDGEYAKSWWEGHNEEGKFVWTYDNMNLYEAELENGRSYLKISSGELKDKIKKEINFSIVVDIYASEMKKFRGYGVDESILIICLEDLSISPNGKFLAAIVTIYHGTLGFGGFPYGVLIPLEKPELIAYPFSRNVYDKAIWSNDSKRIYYYAQPAAGTGNGTVCRLEIGKIEDAEKFFPRPHALLEFKESKVIY